MRTRGDIEGRGKRPEGPGADTLQTTGPGSLQMMILLGLAILVVAVAGVIAYQVVYRDRVILGLKVHGVDVGGLDRDDASKVLQAKLTSYEAGTIVLRQGGQEFKSSPAQMGVRFDTQKTIDKALQSGKEGNPLDKLIAQVGALGAGVSLEPIYSLDGDKFAAFAKRLSLQIDQSVVNGALKIDGDQVRLLPPKEGLALDEAKLRDEIEKEVRALSSNPITIPVTRAAPQITEQDLAPARAMAQQMIAAPIQFTFDGKVVDKWTLPPDKLVGMVTFQSTQVNGKHQVSAALNPDAVRELADKIGEEVLQKGLNARFDYSGGNLKAITQGREGRELDADQFVQSLQTVAVSSGDRKLEVPMKVAKPAVGPNDGAKLGIKELIVQRRTDYSGGAAERRYNVELGTSRIHGVVVAPGDVFSFVDEVGDVTEENGYKLGFAIIGADTLPDPGGGICQVSTTTFQSIFLAGYEIVERIPHAYRILRYEAPMAGQPTMTGLDATIYPPDVDFKFRNNTDNYLLIQTRTDGQYMYVSLYGTKPDWTVTTKGPELANVVKADPSIIKQYTPAMAKGREVWVETAIDGVDITFYRTVQRVSQVVSQDKVFTRFRPERNVLLIGTGGAPAPPQEIMTVTPTPVATAEPAEETPTPQPTSPPPTPTKAAAVPTATPTAGRR